MPKRVRSYIFSPYRRHTLLSSLGVYRQAMSEAVAGYRATTSTDKKVIGFAGLSDVEPVDQGFFGNLPEWKDPFTTSLSHHVHGVKIRLIKIIEP